MTRTETPIIPKSDTATNTPREYPVARPTGKPGQLLGMSIDRTGWTDPLERLRVAMNISLDGGSTWLEWCAFEDRGGAEKAPDGTLITKGQFVATAPPNGALVKVTTLAAGKPTAQAVSLVEVS